MLCKYQISLYGNFISIRMCQESRFFKNCFLFDLFPLNQECCNQRGTPRVLAINTGKILSHMTSSEMCTMRRPFNRNTEGRVFPLETWTSTSPRSDTMSSAGGCGGSFSCLQASSTKTLLYSYSAYFCLPPLNSYLQDPWAAVWFFFSWFAYGLSYSTLLNKNFLDIPDSIYGWYLINTSFD